MKQPKKSKELKEPNMQLETILWMDRQIDDIIAQCALLEELLEEENNLRVVEKYNNKLKDLEQQLDNIQHKLDVEKKIAAKQRV